MKAMNLKHFRFSLSWSRLLPEGIGKVSADGINFYNKVIDFCLECDIEPWVTLYHWDLPQKLEEKGGWTNRKILEWFKEYVTLCAQSFGDRVKHWMVLNEPMVFTGAGYFLGVHAPGRKGLKNFLPAVHHATLCQALGGRIVRKLVTKASVGTTFSCSYIEAYSSKEKDILAAKKADAIMPVLKRIDKYMQTGDDVLCVFDFDFIGVQNYTREIVKHSYFVPYLRAKIVKATKRNVKTTLMDWEVYPPSI